MREVLWGVVDGYDRAAVINLVGIRACDGEHVGKEFGLRGEKTSVDAECRSAISGVDEDKVAVVEPEFRVRLGASKYPSQAPSWGSIERRTLGWSSRGVSSCSRRAGFLYTLCGRGHARRHHCGSENHQTTPTGRRIIHPSIRPSRAGRVFQAPPLAARSRTCVPGSTVQSIVHRL